MNHKTKRVLYFVGSQRFQSRAEADAHTQQSGGTVDEVKHNEVHADPNSPRYDRLCDFEWCRCSS